MVGLDSNIHYAMGARENMEDIPTFRMAAIRAFSHEKNSPFEMLVRHLNEVDEYGCFIFAENVSMRSVDFWETNLDVKVHWWKDLTPVSSTTSAHSRKKQLEYCAAVVELKLPTSVDSIIKAYYPEDEEKPAGAIIISKNSYPPHLLMEFYKRKVTDPDENPTRFIDYLFKEWGILGFERDIPIYGERYHEEAIFVSKTANLSEDIINWGKVSR